MSCQWIIQHRKDSDYLNDYKAGDKTPCPDPSVIRTMKLGAATVSLALCARHLKTLQRRIALRRNKFEANSGIRKRVKR